MTKKVFEIYSKIIIFVLLGFTANGQSILLNGRVTGSQGVVISGVNVQLVGKNAGTISDDKGYFKIAIGSANDRLAFSAIGYIPKEIVVGNATTIEVVLQEDNQTLGEVVVTALGIKRAEKSLGFAAQTLQSKALLDAKTNNWINSISGKVAGLNIQGVGGGPMGSSRITLRGESSLNLDNNQALIVVDGVPISGKITGTGFNSHLAADSPIDYGSTVSDLNPDDIETVTVLKGPGATALYGSRAAGGALVITTKTGVRKDKGIGVTINSNFNVEQVNRWPDYQFEYEYNNNVDVVKIKTEPVSISETVEDDMGMKF
jgi:TonB-dependent SusC/RagA subfamily outer membrane receptor